MEEQLCSFSIKRKFHTHFTAHTITIGDKNGQGAMTLRGNYPLSNNGFETNDSSQNIGAKLGLWGSAISTFGDALQTIAAAIAIEESRIADQQQQQALEKLQSQIDDLKKEQSQNNSTNIDMESLNNLLQRIADRLEMNDEKTDES